MHMLVRTSTCAALTGGLFGERCDDKWKRENRTIRGDIFERNAGALGLVLGLSDAGTTLTLRAQNQCWHQYALLR